MYIEELWGGVSQSVPPRDLWNAGWGVARESAFPACIQESLELLVHVDGSGRVGFGVLPKVENHRPGLSILSIWPVVEASVNMDAAIHGGQSGAELRGRRKSERGWAKDFRLAGSFKAEGLAGRSICLREVPVAKLCGRQAGADSVPDRSHTQEPQTDPLIKEMCSQCRGKLQV